MSKSSFMEAEYSIGDWIVHPQLNFITRGDKSTHIEPKVMEVLACLAERAGQVLSKETIIRSVWEDTFVTDDVLIRAISELRRAFEDDKKEPSVIRTVPKRGYQLIEPVRILNMEGERNGGNGNGLGSRDPFCAVTQPDFPIGLDSPPAHLPSRDSSPYLARLRTNGGSLTGYFEDRGPMSHRPLAWMVASACLCLLILALTLTWHRTAHDTPKAAGMLQLTSNGSSKDGGMATDGTRIYFTEYLEGRTRLASVSVRGGTITPIESPLPAVRILDISPDGLDLLVEELSSPGLQNPLWVQPVTGGQPRRLGTVSIYHLTGASWSPSENKIAYSALNDPGHSQEGAVYIVGEDGMSPQKILVMPSPVSNIRWSPDGTRLRFALGNAFWEVASDGSNLHTLLPGWQVSPFQNQDLFGAWTPDGKYFFFTAFESGVEGIYGLRESSFFSFWRDSQPFRLSLGPFGISQPLLSRDGSRIFCLGGSVRTQLVKYVGTTGTVEPYLSGISAEMTDFSKDGQWVAYVSLPEANLIRSRINGDERLQLTSHPLRISTPAWSPDGKTIGFMARTRADEEFKIYFISPSGGDLHFVVEGLGPSWSPDGRYILFEHSGPGTPELFHILDLETNLVTDVPGSEDKAVPRWSPDGRYIAATAAAWSQLVVFDFETKAWHTLARYQGVREGKDTGKSYADGIFYPTWSRDGKSIFYIDWTPGFAGYYRVSLSGGEPEMVIDFSFPTSTPVESVSGTLGGWFGLAPDDSPIFPAKFAESEIYAIEWEEQ